MNVSASEALRRRPLHTIVRELPETTAVFRAHGVDLPARGADPLGDVAASGRDAAALLEALAEATRWRQQP